MQRETFRKVISDSYNTTKVSVSVYGRCAVTYSCRMVLLFIILPFSFLCFNVMDEPNKRDWLKLITMRRVDPDKKERHIFLLTPAATFICCLCTAQTALARPRTAWVRLVHTEAIRPVTNSCGSQWMGENRRVHSELTRIISCESQALYLPWIERGDGSWTNLLKIASTVTTAAGR